MKSHLLLIQWNHFKSKFQRLAQDCTQIHSINWIGVYWKRWYYTTKHHVFLQKVALQKGRTFPSLCLGRNCMKSKSQETENVPPMHSTSTDMEKSSMAVRVHKFLCPGPPSMFVRERQGLQLYKNKRKMNKLLHSCKDSLKSGLKQTSASGMFQQSLQQYI